MEKYICKDCGKEFDAFNSLHGHWGHCKLHKERKKTLIDKIVTKEFLTSMFIDSLYSTLYVSNEILKDYDISNLDIIKQAKYFNIKLPTSSQSALLETTRNMYKTTCKEKYGEENALTFGTTCYKKRNNTVKEKYGVDNVFQLQSTKDSSKITMLSNYGVEYPTHVPHRYKNVGVKSYQHRMVENWLIENNIEFISEKIVKETKKFNSVMNKVYQPRPDILIKDYKIIIEIYGDKWHANPEKYNDDDLIILWSGEKTAKEIRDMNFNRENHLNECEFIVIVLWASKIMKHKQNNIKENLIKEINKWKSRLESQKLKESIMKYDTIYL
jgi:G:T-mismatch repair DNA endonuclease (very short patch repair protein)